MRRLPGAAKLRVEQIGMASLHRRWVGGGVGEG